MAYKRVQRTFVSSNSLTDRISGMLRDDIAKGKYKPGRQLPAGKDLGERFGVSITVIREALARLKSDGLIASHQGKGVFVADDSTARPFRLPPSGAKKRTLAHIFELRIGIEVQAAMLAAERRHDRDLKAMTKFLRAMEPGQASFEDALAADIGFHLAIAEATQNPLIVGFTQFLQPHLNSFISQSRGNSAKNPATERMVYKEHLSIFDAISAADPRRAGMAVRKVLEGSLQRLSR
jgi:DNA-binding FadR family transcriptional regulator